MEEDWKCIYRSNKHYEVEIYHGVLEGNGIESVVINKQDSAYLFGEVELYVKAEDVLEANRILNETTL
jgi:hypothetical protein